MRRFTPSGAVWKQGERGQALLELALTLPILCVLLMGVAEFGRFAYFAIEVANAAHMGAAYGAQNNAYASDSTTMSNYASYDGSNVPGGVNTTTSYYCTCSVSGTSTCLPTDCSGANNRIVEYVKVNTTATVSPMFKYPGISKSLTLNGQAIMRVEQ